jgi:hypothetical protein
VIQTHFLVEASNVILILISGQESGVKVKVNKSSGKRINNRIAPLDAERVEVPVLQVSDEK